MFVCQVTGKLSTPGEKLNRIVARTRPRTYFRMEKDPETNRWSEVESGHGVEIVQEIRATAEGVLEWESMTEAQRTEHLKHV